MTRISAMTLCLALLGETVALAEDYSMPGTACQSHGIDGSIGAPTLNLVHIDGYVTFNDQGAWPDYAWSLDCPVLRHGWDSTAINDISVIADDGNNINKVKCVAGSCDRYGTCSYTASQNTGNAPMGTGLVLPLGNLPGYPKGYAYLYCTIPGSTHYYSKIRGYSWSD